MTVRPRLRKASFMQKPKSLRHLALSSLLCLVVVAGCASPEQKRKQREQFMEKFVESAVGHLFDKNPTTMKESVGTLMREEMPDENLQKKLQTEKLLPDTALDILRITQEAQEAGRTNKVAVIATPESDTTKDDVTYRVSAKETINETGKPEKENVHKFKVVVKLTKEMGRFPVITDVIGLTKPVETAADKPPDKTSTPTKKRKRRH